MKVQRVLPSYDVDMGGMLLKQPLPTQAVDQIDPFILLHHHNISIAPNSIWQREGVGPHPHRGFTPVTFIFEGALQHRDSRGNNSIVHAGGLQWMDVGLGIIHSERPPASLCLLGGVQHMIQVWINLPARMKMMEPNYMAFELADLPKAPGHPEIGISAGSPIPSVKGPVKSAYPIHAFHGRSTTEPLKFTVPEGHNAFLYILTGGGRLEGFGLAEAETLYDLVPGEHVFLPKEPSHVLFLSGEPINEKKEQRGPFVMNSQTELLEAMRDYPMGKMGFLVESEMP